VKIYQQKQDNQKDSEVNQGNGKSSDGGQILRQLERRAKQKIRGRLEESKLQ